jgi:hypothetical protein
MIWSAAAGRRFFGASLLAPRSMGKIGKSQPASKLA